jgi:zinc transporter
MSARAGIVDGGTSRDASLEEATNAIGRATFVWVHIDGDSDQAQTWLGARGLDPPVIRALMATETRPRMDVIGNGAILNLRGPDAAAERHPDLLASIRMWVTNGWAVSVTLRPLLALDPVHAAFQRGDITDAGDLVSEFAGEIIGELDPQVAALGDALDSCEERVGGQNALVLRRSIATTRTKAIAYRRFVAPQRTALERLAVLERDWLDADDRLHLREAADRAARMAEELEAIRERAGLVHEQLTDLRAELIETRSLVISIVALVFLPLTFLTGLLGMNVNGIPFARESWAFWGVVAISAAIAMLIAAYFIRARWFR